MNKLLILLASLAVLAVACDSKERIHSSFSGQIIEYQIDEKTYGVVIPENQDISAAQAKRLARQKAAEITVGNGGRYFTIQAEGPVKLAKSNRDGPDSQDLPTNLYQELIIQQNFGRESLERNTPPSMSVVLAYRIVFQIHKEKPSWGTGIDACALTECE